MNKKGFISISALYSFFLVFCLLLILIMTTYSDNRINFKMIKNDAKKWAYDKSTLKNRYETLPDNPIIKPPNDPSKPGTPDNPGTDPDPVIPDTPTVTNEGYKTVLINNGGGATTYDEAISYIKGRTRPDFSTVATTKEGMFATTDNFGTSYYFRGAVDNNWVKYGKVNGQDIYWRIVRINGDNSIRMIYSGTVNPASDATVIESGGVLMKTSSTGVGTSKYNNSSNRAEYVGYMYMTNSQHGNGTSNPAKTTADNWFKNTTLNGDANVVDNIFCNDRNTNSTWYSIPSSNLVYGPRNRSLNTLTPMLYCENVQDRFTKSTSIGNGKLTYPVGLITSDEISLAGSYWLTNNTSFYLYTGYSYYTMSPNLVKKYSSGSVLAYVFIFTNQGNMPNYSVTNTAYIRPVINLSSSVKFTGTGTYNDVYEVAE